MNYSDYIQNKEFFQGIRDSNAYKEWFIKTFGYDCTDPNQCALHFEDLCKAEEVK